MSEFGSSETEVIETLLPRYRAEGFDVYVNPSRAILPPFLQSYQPDAIALKKDRKIAIEVIGSRPASAGKIKRLESLFAGQNEWELQVFYASSLTSAGKPVIETAAAIEEAIQRVSDLKAAGHFLPALVMAWATFEAVGRALLPEQFEQPQISARLIEVLASEGYVTPQEASVLRDASSVRNAVVHGTLNPKLDSDLLERFVEVLKLQAALLAEVQAVGPTM